jgi:hypothetical protein
MRAHKHAGHALAVAASSLLIADILLVVATFFIVLKRTWMDQEALEILIGNTPLPVAIYGMWALGVLGTAAAITAIALYGFRERWFWRCLIVAALMWLVFPPVHTLIGVISLILLFRFRKAFPVRQDEYA